MKNLAQSIPARVRTWIYVVLGTAFTVESTLDAFDYGVIAAKPQGAAIAVLSALGFSMAFSNVKPEVETV